MFITMMLYCNVLKFLLGWPLYNNFYFSAMQATWVMLLSCPQNLVQCLGHSTHSLMPIDWMLEECRPPVAKWKAPSGHGYAGRSCPFALAQGQISSCNPHCWCPSQNFLAGQRLPHLLWVLDGNGSHLHLFQEDYSQLTSAVLSGDV